MKRNFVLVALLVLLAAGATVALLGGPKALFGPPAGPGEGGAGGTAPEAVGAGAGADGRAAGGTEAGRDGVLAGRRRPERKGLGALTARVVRVGTEKPVPDAVLAVKGSGYGGELVDAGANGDAQGLVALTHVPAGEGYEVRVQVAGEPAIVIPDVEVRAGRTKDLGTVVVGARAPLAGRVVDEAGAPIAGADVRAFTGYGSLLDVLGNMMELFSTLGREPKPLAKTATDAEGRFRLTDLPPGLLVVRASAPGRRQTIAQVRMTPGGPAAGEPTLVLEPGSPVAGVVVDADGVGVPAATLAFMDDSGAEDPTQILGNRVFATTDAKGAFQAIVSEGARRLRAIVEAEGFPTTMAPEVKAGDTAVRIVLGRGAEIEIALTEAGTGKPVDGGQVLLAVTAKGSMNDPASTGGILYGVTDAQGSVVLASPPGAVEMLMASHPRYGSGIVSPGRDGGDMLGRATGLEGDFPKEIKAGVRTRIPLRFRLGVVVTGRVLGPGNVPIAGAEVRPLSFFGGGGGGTAVRSGADGAYRLEGVATGDAPGAFVMARAPGFVHATANVGAGVLAEPGAEIHHDFVLVPGAVIRGRVLDEAGQAVAGAEVGLAGRVDVESLLGSGAATSLSDGTFVLRDVDPSGKGPFDALAVTRDEPADGAKTPAKLRLRATADGFVAATSAEFAVPEGGEVEAPPIRLSRGAVLRGVVRDPAGGAVAGAQVEMSFDPEGEEGDATGFNLARLTNHRTMRADREGRFEAKAVPKGGVTVTAKAAGFASSRRTVKVTAEDAPPAVEVTLRTALDLSGRVFGGDGRPLEGASVSSGGTIEGLEGDAAYAEPRSETTDANGQFVLRGLPPGTETVTVSADGHKTAHASAAPGGTGFEVRLEARSASTAKRLKEIEQEMQEVGMKFAAAKDQTEREAIQSRLVELMQEQRRLRQEGGATEDGPTPPEAVSGPK